MATFIKNKNPRKPYTIRYYHENRQHEKSFATAREARDFKAKFEHDSREQIFTDPRIANMKFADAASSWLARHTGSPKTKANYEMALRLHITPAFGGRGLNAVANDRDGMERFLRETLPAKGLGVSMIRTSYMVVNAIVNDAIKTGKLTRTRLRGIELPVAQSKASIVFATHEQVAKMAAEMPEPFGITVYLMRGCGLRLGEALGWNPGDFNTPGVLRLQRQLSPDGTLYIPLKHRRSGDYRDIPVPGYVYAAADGNAGLLMVSHRQYRWWFNRARDAAGLPPTFTPHMLRHIFASVCLAKGIPITDVSAWLGHRNIQVTYGIYGHLLPASQDRGRGALQEEWES